MAKLDIFTCKLKTSPNIKANFGVIHICFLQLVRKRYIIAQGAEKLTWLQGFVIKCSVFNFSKIATHH